jgi:hypothetical protein
VNEYLFSNKNLQKQFRRPNVSQESVFSEWKLTEAVQKLDEVEVRLPVEDSTGYWLPALHVFKSCTTPICFQKVLLTKISEPCQTYAVNYWLYEVKHLKRRTCITWAWSSALGLQEAYESQISTFLDENLRSGVLCWLVSWKSQRPFLVCDIPWGLTNLTTRFISSRPRIFRDIIKASIWGKS